jgi:hypothetical protein
MECEELGKLPMAGIEVLRLMLQENPVHKITARCRGKAVLGRRSVFGVQTPKKLLATDWLLFDKFARRYRVKSAAPEGSVGPRCKLGRFKRDLKNPFELYR